MSFCIRLSNLNKYKSLPEYTKGSCCKKAFLHIRYKGSYTLEMAVILPLTAAFFVSVLFHGAFTLGNTNLAPFDQFVVVCNKHCLDLVI